MPGIRVLSAAILLLAAAMSADAKGHVGAYSAKKAAPKQGYSYRTYRYYSPKNASYKQHVVVYYNSRSNYAYYYNPESKKYWGRCNMTTGKYNLLPAPQRQSTVMNVPESVFLPAGEMPPPEVGMAEQMLPPPECIMNAMEDSTPRQFYSRWNLEDGRRYVCHYFYKSHPLDTFYKRQTVVFYPEDGKDRHYYFFNEEKQQFWGRCAASAHPQFTPQVSQWQMMQKGGDQTWGPLMPGDPTIPGAVDREAILRIPEPIFGN